MTLQIIHCEAERDFSRLSMKSKFWLNMLEEKLNYPFLCKKLFHKIVLWSSSQCVQTNKSKKYYKGVSGHLWNYIILGGFMILVFLSFIQFLICCNFLLYFKEKNFMYILSFVFFLLKRPQNCINFRVQSLDPLQFSSSKRENFLIGIPSFYFPTSESSCVSLSERARKLLF